MVLVIALVVAVIGVGGYVLVRKISMGNTGSYNNTIFEDLGPTVYPQVADVKIAHISDTHNLHDQVTADLLALNADMLIHTGDFSADGTDAEFADFNRWLGEIKDKFPRGVYMILGNHDYKFLNGVTLTEELVATLADDEGRRNFVQQKLSNAVILDAELRSVPVGTKGELKLNLYACPWYPFQSSPTYPDRVGNVTEKSDHDRVFRKWSEGLSEQRKSVWGEGEAWRYDEIPTDGSVDILLTHVPPFGVFDKQPLFSNWGSSNPLLDAIKVSKPRAHLFGHVHAQRGCWEKVDTYVSDASVISTNENRKIQTKIVGAVQYASSTNEEVKEELLAGSEATGIQLLSNSALMSDRTVQPLAKKKIVGKPRLISGSYIISEGKGAWHFRATGGESK
eukprot:TRINITY_DN4988_c0_g1_i1.p1 TRINITY_DN4988_c0_g1~~TRINITY_DN4988_c0_g1_i1.p1  ORF type:complete len:394 (-),score=68.17 TRINITY_DN4988_c0_g1_i1:59-1240(-)